MYIAKTLTCIIQQSYKKFELIVVNDGSTDSTLREAEKVRDPRIKLINTTNGGAAKARNIAYNQSKGHYIIFFDADDWIPPNFVAEQLRSLNNRDNVVVLSRWERFYNDDIISDQNVSSSEKEISLYEWITFFWYNSNPMTAPGRAIIPRKLINLAGLWSEKLSLNDDLEFFTRLFINAEKIIINNRVNFYYRSGINGLSAKKGPKANLSLYNSVLISTELVLRKIPGDLMVKQAIANLWKSFIYVVYPDQMNLIRLAESKIKELGGATLSYPSGGYTKFLLSIVGWKMTKLITKLIKK